MSAIADETQVQEQGENELLGQALEEPAIADAMNAYLRALEYLPALDVQTPTYVYFSTGANA